MKPWPPALLMDYYGPLLTERQRDVLALYHHEDLSLAEIAAQLGVSRQGVHDMLRRSVAQMQALEEKLGFIARERELQAALEQAAALLRAGDIDAAQALLCAAQTE